MVFHGTEAAGTGGGSRVELKGGAKRSGASLNIFSAGDGTQGSVHAPQAPHQLSHTSSSWGFLPSPTPPHSRT